MRQWSRSPRSKAQAIVVSAADTLPAYGGVCKECHWYTACQGQLKEFDDLTLIPGLGRSRRDAMLDHLATRVELAEINLKDTEILAPYDSVVARRRTWSESPLRASL